MLHYLLVKEFFLTFNLNLPSHSCDHCPLWYHPLTQARLCVWDLCCYPSSSCVLLLHSSFVSSGELMKSSPFNLLVAQSCLAYSGSQTMQKWGGSTGFIAGQEFFTFLLKNSMHRSYWNIPTAHLGRQYIICSSVVCAGQASILAFSEGQK